MSGALLVSLPGSRRDSVHGTSAHGLFDDDPSRHSCLGEVAAWLGAHLDLGAVDEIAATAR